MDSGHQPVIRVDIAVQGGAAAGGVEVAEGDVDLGGAEAAKVYGPMWT
jgi:hypothetical protein